MECQIRSSVLQNSTSKSFLLEVLNVLSFNSLTTVINHLHPKLNPICHLLVLLGAHPILHISKIRVNLFDVNESMHCDVIVKVTNKMQLYRLSYYSKSALHVSGDVFAHHQEHLTVFTVPGSVHPSCCRLPAGSNLGEHYQIL